MLCSFEISPSLLSSCAPSSLTSLNPAVITIAPLIPFLPHSSSTAGTTSFFVTITARSISSLTSRTLLYAFLSKTVSLVGLIGKIFPVYPFKIFDVIARPTLPSLSEAPIIAIDFGDRKKDSLILTRCFQMAFYNKFIRSSVVKNLTICNFSAPEHFSGHILVSWNPFYLKIWIFPHKLPCFHC